MKLFQMHNNIRVQIHHMTESGRERLSLEMLINCDSTNVSKHDVTARPEYMAPMGTDCAEALHHPDMILQSGTLQDPTAYEAACMHPLINHALSQMYELKRLTTPTIALILARRKTALHLRLLSTESA